MRIQETSFTRGYDAQRWEDASRIQERILGIPRSNQKPRAKAIPVWMNSHILTNQQGTFAEPTLYDRNAISKQQGLIDERTLLLRENVN